MWVGASSGLSLRPGSAASLGCKNAGEAATRRCSCDRNCNCPKPYYRVSNFRLFFLQKVFKISWRTFQLTGREAVWNLGQQRRNYLPDGRLYRDRFQDLVALARWKARSVARPATAGLWPRRKCVFVTVRGARVEPFPYALVTATLRVLATQTANNGIATLRFPDGRRPLCTLTYHRMRRTLVSGKFGAG